jgi:hypothetical protein
MIELKNPQVELLNRKRSMETRDPYQGMDKQELAEREEAARAYAGEDEKHFVDYATDCIEQSVKAQESIRKTQDDCWNVYLENEPASYADKEEWQSRIVIPKPFQTIQYAASAIKKAFSPNYINIENSKDKKGAEFWKRLLDTQCNNQHARFILRFTDATIMALAVGVSMEVLVRWIPGKGLEFTLVEPWKILRDPDAASRDPQSGRFWIHQEWLDYYVLKNGEAAGRYFDVARVKEVEDTDTSNPFLTKEAVAKRREQIWQRSNYVQSILTSEFWGIVLDKKGEELLPSARYTIAGGRVIQLPKAPLYKNHRWPGISYSPLPDILRHGGRGLLEGIMSVWEAMNNMVCLHQDYMQWVVNPPTEVNVDALIDPNDSVIEPGRDYPTRDTVSGQQAIRTVQRRSRTNDVMSNMQFYDQYFQRGSFVPDSVQGLPGWRKDITYREAAMNLDQAMGVYGLMGENLESGAVMILEMVFDIMVSQIGYRDLQEVFTDEEIKGYGIEVDDMSPTGISGLPVFDGSFHVSGIESLMRETSALLNLKDIIIPLSGDPRYGKYIRPYKVLKSIETMVNLRDEDVIVDEDEAKLIDQQAQLMQAGQMEASQRLQELQEALGVAELAKRIGEIEATGEKNPAAVVAKLTEGAASPPKETPGMVSGNKPGGA